MQTLALSLRETHRYVGTYQGRDQWRQLGAIQVTPPRVTEEGNGYDEGDTVVRYARIRRADDFRLIKQAIEDTMTRQGCSHEYDCCGCASWSTRVKRIRPGLLLIRTRVTFNY